MVLQQFCHCPKVVGSHAHESGNESSPHFPNIGEALSWPFFFSHLSSCWETDLVWATQRPAEKMLFFDCFCGSLTHHSTPSARQESTLAAEAEVDHSMRLASFKYGWVQRPESSRDGWVLLSHILIYSGFYGRLCACVTPRTLARLGLTLQILAADQTQSGKNIACAGWVRWQSPFHTCWYLWFPLFNISKIPGWFEWPQLRCASAAKGRSPQYQPKWPTCSHNSSWTSKSTEVGKTPLR